MNVSCPRCSTACSIAPNLQHFPNSLDVSQQLSARCAPARRRPTRSQIMATGAETCPIPLLNSDAHPWSAKRDRSIPQPAKL
jgi:hypothetical protein